MFSSNHIRRWETHLACEVQIALNCTAFSVSEISVLYKYQKTCLAYSVLRRLRNYTNENSPEGNPCQNSPTKSLFNVSVRTKRFHGGSHQILAKRLGTIQQTRRCDMIPHNTRLCFKEPLKRVAMSKYPQLTNTPFVCH